MPERDLVKTGIAGLDDLLAGGLLRGSVVLVEGAAGTGKTTLGVEFNPDTAWDEREALYKMSGKIVKTYNITQSAEGDKNGLWTTVIASAILLP